MGTFNASNTIKNAEQEYGLESGGSLKIKEGANKLRLLSDTVPHQSWYKGTQTVKFVCWIYDYKDERVKLYFMPFTILKGIESLQLSEDYKFDEVPMPYDITINAMGAGTKEVKYQVVPARNNSPVPEKAVVEFAKKASLEEVLTKLRENQAKNPDNQPPALPPLPTDVKVSAEVNPEDIPF